MVGSLDEFSVCVVVRGITLSFLGEFKGHLGTPGVKLDLKPCEHNRSRVWKFSNMVNCV